MNTRDTDLDHLNDGTGIPAPGIEDWHNRYGGRQWKYDSTGVFTKEYENGKKPLRTRGNPLSCRKIADLFGPSILKHCRHYEIPPAIIMMTIATETAFLRTYGFTGPHSFRWESHVQVKDVDPPTWGDYSAGPMQLLATTARYAIGQFNLNYDPKIIAPPYAVRPEPPADIPLYDPDINIEIGAAFIHGFLKKTGSDPILVAAHYNAGSLRKSTSNPWCLASNGDHLDRAAQWYGDACFVLKECNLLTE